MDSNNTSGYLVRLAEFSFPKTLDDDQANFRLQVDLRYRASKGDFAMKTVLMPGLHSYWECSIEENRKQYPELGGDRNGLAPKAQKDKFKRIRVRTPHPNHDGTRDDRRFLSEVNVGKIGDWDKSFRVNARTLYELRVSVLDVDRADWFDKFVETIKGTIGVLTAVPVVGSALEPLIEGIASSLGSELVNNDDKVLFIGEAELKNNKYEIRGDDYQITFGVGNA